MQLATIFQNGAILQRNTIIPVWGKTAPGINVCGKLNGTTTFSCSSSAGDFILYFPAQCAGGPYTLEVSSAEGAIVLEDIYIGEVWLASGQSNMQYQLNSDWRGKSDAAGIPLGREQEKEFFETVDRSKVFRYFTVPQLATGGDEYFTSGEWKTVDPDCAAVAAWFGLYLQKNLDIPMGVIVAAWGGTIAEAWMSYQALACCPQTRPFFEKAVQSHFFEKNYDVAKSISGSDLLKAVIRPDSENTGFEKGFHLPDADISSWGNVNVPGSWIKQDVSGNGAVWIRKKISIPAEWVGKELLFSAGAVDKQDITYCNGVEIGRTGEGASMTTYNLPRNYTIPAEVVTSTELHIAVRAYSACFDGSFGGSWLVENSATKEQINIEGQWKVKVELNLGILSPKRDSSLYGRGNQHTPGILFNSMIKPLIPYAIAGTIWYQGESNAHNPIGARLYYDILEALIADWRRNFLNPEMPFIMVQLAGYGEYSTFSEHSAWAYLRESQRKLAATIPGVGMASAVDCGEKLDIHPQDKQTVGFRMAAYALNKVYGQLDTVPNGPELLRIEQIASGTVRLDFARAKNMYIDEECDQSFYLSENGEDYYCADEASVDGASVMLRCKKLEKVSFVRYAWSDFPPNTLYNGDGFPASPFIAEVK